MNKAGAGLAALLLVGGGAVWWSQRDGGEPDINVSNLTPVAVTYHVRGTADGVDITVETPTGTEQASDRRVPLGSDDGLGITIIGFLPGDFVYISAQNTGDDGSVICSIEGSDGQTISENTSEGAYTIATCDGSAR